MTKQHEKHKPHPLILIGSLVSELREKNDKPCSLIMIGCVDQNKINYKHWKYDNFFHATMKEITNCKRIMNVCYAHSLRLQFVFFF